VLAYAILSKGTPIYEMVSGAYQITLVGAFVPLVCGLYWQRATRYGAIASIIFGVLTWVMFLATPLGEAFPAQLAGVLMAGVGMIGGSLLSKPHTHHAHASADHHGTHGSHSSTANAR
jgi:solute:Na+ symporter, SSS family